MSAELDLTIDRQDDETFRFIVTELVNGVSSPVDLTGQNLQFQIFPDKNYIDAEMIVEIDAVIPTGANATAGIADITIPTTDTDQNADKKLYYKARLIGAGGTSITTLTRGKLAVQG
jgi:hypothetical protein